MPLIQNYRDNLALQFDARQNDLERVAKLLDPRTQTGATFAGKQAILRTGGNTLGGIASGTASAIAAIIAQVPVAGTGTHFLINDLQRRSIATYVANKNASNEAIYRGTITIRHNPRRMRGAKTFEDQEFGGAQTSDYYGKTGFVSTNPSATDPALPKLLEKDTLPVIFSVVGTNNNAYLSTVPFRGFVTGLTDSFSANWNGINYVGRSEPLYIYNSTSRTLGFRLQIPIFSSAETAQVYRKVNGLMSYTYGKYSEAGLNEGTLLRIRVGDYFKGYGVLTTVNHTVDTNIPWSSSPGFKNSEERALILPQVITLQIGMNIIHERLPERYTGAEALEYSPPYIANTAKPSEPSEKKLVEQTGIITQGPQFFDNGTQLYTSNDQYEYVLPNGEIKVFTGQTRYIKGNNFFFPDDEAGFNAFNSQLTLD